MRYRTALAITMTIMLLGSLIPFSNHQVLDESKEISFADSEPAMLALAGSSTGHVNSSFIEPAFDGWVISGDTRNNMQFGSINLAATSAQNGGNDADAYVAKVDHNGNWQWAVMPDASAGLVFLQAMTTDPVGNIYIGGLVWGQVNFGTNMVTTPNSAGDGFVAKLDPQGNWVWAQMFNTIPESNGSSRINGLAIDPLTGDVIASGSQSGETTFGSTVLNNTDTEYLLVNLDSFLGDFNWVSSAGGIGTDIGYDVGVDGNGNIWQVGVTSGTFSANGNSHQIISQQDSVLVKWTVSSGVAQVSSVKGLASGAGEINIADDLIVSSSGDIFITGVFIGTLDAGNQKTVTASGTNNADGFVVKVGSNGATSWINSLGSTSGFDWATSVSESPSGEFAIGGFFSGTVTFGTQSISSNGGRDGFVAQIDDMGSWDWAENIGGAYDDIFGDVTTNMDGNYSATGSFQDTITKGSKSITSTAGWDLYVWTIDPSQNADKDNDGVNDLVDNCPNTNNPLQYDSDLDGDGDECDYDDDNDGITDNSGDDCPRGGAWNWTSDSTTDFDNDGCKDDSEDSDDDNDGIADVDDDCDNSSYNPPRDWWISNSQNDIDQDGCRDSDEDSDDDGDGIDDVYDDCSNVYGSSSIGDYIGCVDSDGDGLADIEDDCPNQFGNSTLGGAVGCLDSDGDGWQDADDAMPENPTQWHDTDGDGFGDNPDGTTPDACISVPGDSLLDRFGCPDSDDDGYSSPDSDWTVEDGADAFPTDETQWSDWDLDGFGDNWGNESWSTLREELSSQSNWPGEYFAFARDQDSCPTLEGTSWQDDILGCPDSDGDGWANFMDAFPGDPDEYLDSDGDGFADGKDDCPEENGSSSEDRNGCKDSDGDGWSDPEMPNYMPVDGADMWPLDPERWADSDGDFIADNFDDCPDENGLSELGNLTGCIDSDFDGWADLIDAFPQDAFEHMDTDGDMVGDNRDECPTVPGVDSENGCEKVIVEESSNVVLVGGIGGGVLVLALVAGLVIWKMRGNEEEENWSEAPVMPDMTAQVTQQMYAQPAMPDMSATTPQANYGQSLYAQTAYTQPVVEQPVYSAPVAQPAAPVQPAYTEPVAQPVAPVQPVYQQPTIPAAMPDLTALPGRDVVQQPLTVSPPAPTVNDVGTMRSDGNEWLEYPEASGAWYARDANTRQWIRKI